MIYPPSVFMDEVDKLRREFAKQTDGLKLTQGEWRNRWLVFLAERWKS